MSAITLHALQDDDARLAAWTGAIQQALMRFNHQAQPLDFAPIRVFAELNTLLLGGLIGTVGWRWINIDVLYVEPHARLQGIASRLLANAEAQARARGCIGSFVDTFDFQAVDFYRKNGYEPFGELIDMPPGHRRVYLQKRWS